MRPVAEALRPVVRRLIGERVPVALRFWDGSSLGPPDAGATIDVESPRAIRRLLFAPVELALGRAYVAGEIDIQGDALEVLGSVPARPSERASLRVGLGGLGSLARAAASVGALGLPPRAPKEEARLRGRRHSRARDAGAIAHHYDVSNEFYRLVLGKTMTYSCAYFPTQDTSLDDAQHAKHDLVCRKLGLRPGMRLLDVGCGWGGMVLHAAERHGTSAVGITLSRAQADLAAKRVAEAGLSHRVEIRVQDYRDVGDGPFDAVASIGMFEHVGQARTAEYFRGLFGLLAPKGRLLNHAISRPEGSSRLDRNSFMARYVFPDGELQEVGAVVTAMHQQGFEVRDVESLREHYALTLRAWVANIERNWTEAERLADPARARIWRLYMAGAALAFEAGRIGVHQVLGVRPDAGGRSGMPATRADMLDAGR